MRRDGDNVMVWFMYHKETRDYAPDSGPIGLSNVEADARLEFADPDAVHWRAKKDNVVKRKQGYPLKPETLPKRYLWASDDLDEFLPGFVVSPRFRDLIEQFEPGAHQFVPVEICRTPDGPAVATYYWFIICQRVDSVDREHTTFVWKAPADEPDEGYWVDSEFDPKTSKMIRYPDSKLVFNNRQVGHHHVWHDPHLLTFANGLCSDAFAQAALGQNFSGFGAVPRESAGAAAGALAHG